jgi:hypothetical protein
MTYQPFLCKPCALAPKRRRKVWSLTPNTNTPAQEARDWLQARKYRTSSDTWPLPGQQGVRAVQ